MSPKKETERHISSGVVAAGAAGALALAATGYAVMGKQDKGGGGSVAVPDPSPPDPSPPDPSPDVPKSSPPIPRSTVGSAEKIQSAWRNAKNNESRRGPALGKSKPVASPRISQEQMERHAYLKNLISIAQPDETTKPDVQESLNMYVQVMTAPPNFIFYADGLNPTSVFSFLPQWCDGGVVSKVPLRIYIPGNDMQLQSAASYIEYMVTSLGFLSSDEVLSLPHRRVPPPTVPFYTIPLKARVPKPLDEFDLLRMRMSIKGAADWPSLPEEEKNEFTRVARQLVGPYLKELDGNLLQTHVNLEPYLRTVGDKLTIAEVAHPTYEAHGKWHAVSAFIHKTKSGWRVYIGDSNVQGAVVERGHYRAIVPDYGLSVKEDLQKLFPTDLVVVSYRRTLPLNVCLKHVAVNDGICFSSHLASALLISSMCCRKLAYDKNKHPDFPSVKRIFCASPEEILDHFFKICDYIVDNGLLDAFMRDFVRFVLEPSEVFHLRLSGRRKVKSRGSKRSRRSRSKPRRSNFRRQRSHSRSRRSKSRRVRRSKSRRPKSRRRAIRMSRV